VERSAVSAVPSWECFSTERSAVEGAAVSSEQPLSTPSIQFAILSTTHGPTPVIPTGVEEPAVSFTVMLRSGFLALRHPI
jgi:hypothetical protein